MTSPLFWRPLRPRVRRAPRTPRPRLFRPALEPMESRLAPAAHETLAAAIPLFGGGSTQAQVSDTLANPHATEYYSFSPTQTGALSISLTAADGRALRPRVTLLSESGDLLIQSDAAGPASARLNQSLQPGTYYLAVSAVTDDAAGNQGYTLDASFESALSPAQPLPVGFDPAWVATGDFNHDGHLDLVTANQNGNTASTINTVTVLLGNGDGTFRPGATYDVGPNPTYVAVADLRNDGRLDIVTANLNLDDQGNYGAGSISVLLGNGDGTFQDAVTYAVGTAPQAVAIGNFNGHLGIVAVNEIDNTVSVLLGNGDGTFAKAVTYSVTDAAGKGLNPFNVAVGDFRHDGKIDIATANYDDNTVSVLLGNGDGTFGKAVTYSVTDAAGKGQGPFDITVGDFRHDGTLDIATTNQGDNTVSVLLGNGDGTFGTADSYAVGAAPWSVVTGDLRNDGRLDLVVTNAYSDTVSVLLGNGDGTFQKAANYVVGSNPESVAVGDFDGDGRLDLAITNSFASTVSVLLGRGDGTFVSPVTLTVVGQVPTAAATGDFNHDGHLDLVTTSQGNDAVSVLLGNGDGTFHPAASFSVTDRAGHGTGPKGVAVADVNNDGNPDIVTANYDDNSVSVLLGRGDGTFLPAVTYAVGTAPDAVAVGAFAGDGRLDVVTANFSDNTVSVLPGNGDGTFAKAVSYSVTDAAGKGLGPLGVAVGDFDGRLGIATANNQDDTVSVLLGNGDGTFAKAVTYAVGTNPYGIAVGNFNGHVGIAVADSTYDFNTRLYANAASTVSVLAGRGDGTFAPAVSYPVRFNPEGITVGDFSHDGNLDIVTSNFSDSTVSVLGGNGDGTFGPATWFSAGAGPIALAAGDFNNDGSLDVATVNQFDNTVSVLLGPAHTDPVGSRPSAVVVKHDIAGNLIIATTNAGDNTVSVLKGNADAVFNAAGTYAVGKDPAALDVGYLMVVTANAGDNTVSVLTDTGDLAFQPAVGYAVGKDPEAVRLIQDQSGAVDLVTANAGDNTISVLQRGADGSFHADGTYAVGDAPDALDWFSVAGVPYLVVANRGDSTVTILGEGTDGSFQPVKGFTFAVGSEPVALAAGSDGSGNFFIVTANAGDNTVTAVKLDWAAVQRLDPTGPVQTATYQVGRDPRAVQIGYYGDGSLAIDTADQGDNTASVLNENQDGTFQAAVTYRVGAAPDGLAVGFDNLGLITANAGDNTISFVQALFRTAAPQGGISVRSIPQAADLTGAGGTDSLVLTGSGDLVFRHGSGTPGRFDPPVTINAGHPARDATVFRTARGWAVAAVDETGYTVSVYTWDAAAGQFRRDFGFDTGNLPARIAAADLTGDGLDDLVVANNFGASITIAFQTADGQFGTPLTRAVGVAPSDIAFANLGGTDLPSIVVADQVSGDVSVLPNDGTGTSLPAFNQEDRYRAGAGLFDIDASSGQPTVLSQLQTVGVAAADFTGSGRDSLVVVNRGAHSFTLLPDLGQGSFADPQPGVTYATSDRPGQVASLVLPDDGTPTVAPHAGLPSVAILMEDLGQIWIYRNQGDGTFAPPVKVAAGDAPTGFSVTTINGRPALLVGNGYGDVLTLLDDGHGGFAPDRSHLVSAALAVGTIASTGQQFAVVADQKTDTVALYYRVPGTDTFCSPVTVSAASPLPLLAPGAVQTFSVPGDPNPYLVVANSLGNNVLVYHYNPSAAAFRFAASYQVGDNPVSVTVATLTASGLPDLLVANEGSNDVSVLVAALDPATKEWTATPYQRLSSGGSGPLSVAVVNAGSPHGADLLVTNSNGMVALLTGIGSGGQGTGFFRDTNTALIDLGCPVTGSWAASGRAGVYYAANLLGDLVGFNWQTQADLGVVYAPKAGNGVSAAAALPDGGMVVAEQGGLVMVLQPTPGSGLLAVAQELVPVGGIPSNPSALAVLQGAGGLEVLVTNEGLDQLFTFAAGPFEMASLAQGSVSIFLPPLAPGGPVAEATVPDGGALVLVVTLSGGLLQGESAGADLGNHAPVVEAANFRVAEINPEAVVVARTDPSLPESDFGLGIEDMLHRLDLYPGPRPVQPDTLFSRTQPPPGPQDQDLAAAFGRAGDDGWLFGLPVGRPAETSEPTAGIAEAAVRPQEPAVLETVGRVSRNEGELPAPGPVLPADGDLRRVQGLEWEQAVLAVLTVGGLALWVERRLPGAHERPHLPGQKGR